jgi:hypothetical protein
MRSSAIHAPVDARPNDAPKDAMKVKDDGPACSRGRR